MCHKRINYQAWIQDIFICSFIQELYVMIINIKMNEKNTNNISVHYVNKKSVSKCIQKKTRIRVFYFS